MPLCCCLLFNYLSVKFFGQTCARKKKWTEIPTSSGFTAEKTLCSAIYISDNHSVKKFLTNGTPGRPVLFSFIQE